jgi:hypothetical protein
MVRFEQATGQGVAARDRQLRDVLLGDEDLVARDKIRDAGELPDPELRRDLPGARGADEERVAGVLHMGPSTRGQPIIAEEEPDERMRVQDELHVRGSHLVLGERTEEVVRH